MQSDFEIIPKPSEVSANHDSIEESSFRPEEASDNKPKEKKRVSLADYKKRRQLSGVSFPEALPLPIRVDERDCPGTPTLDEELAPLALPTTLNTLPLFEKLDKKVLKRGEVLYF